MESMRYRDEAGELPRVIGKNFQRRGAEAPRRATKSLVCTLSLCGDGPV